MSDKDFIGKRVEDSTKLFGLIEKDTKSFTILFLSITTSVFIYLWVQAKNENISLLKAQIRIEVERQLPQEVSKQVSPIADGWQKASGKIDTLIQNSVK